MKKINYFLASMLLPMAFSVAFTACAVTDGESSSNMTENSTSTSVESIATPVVTLNADRSVSWAKVDGATGYVVNVNGQDGATITQTSYAPFTTVGNYVIKVRAISANTESEWSNEVSYSIFAVTLTTGEGYTLTGVNTVFGGDAYTFKLTQDANTQGTPVVKANGTVLTGENGTYTISNVSANQTITVEGISKKMYAVTKSTGDGYTVTGAESVEHGGNYAFTLNVDEAYSNSTVVVKVNGEIVTAAEGTYTVANVTEALSITVEGVEKNSYAVTPPTAHDAYTFNGAVSVLHGEEYNFTLSINTGYDASGVVVKVNGAPITATEGTYTVTNVTGALEITVEGLNVASYDVTLPTNGVGYTVDGAATVQHGATYTFTVTLDEAYNKSDITVKANGIIVEAVSGSYSVASVTEALTITVEGVLENSYTVSVPTSAQYTVEGANSVAHGGTATVTITPANAEDMLVVKNGATVLTGEANVYTLENVTADIELTVEVVGIANQLLYASAWDGLYTADNSVEGDHIEVWNGAKLQADYLQKVWEAGYTHLVFHSVSSAATGRYIWNNGASSDDKYMIWANNRTEYDVRIDLNEFKNADGSFNYLLNELGVNAVISNVRLYKSQETLDNWTKSTTNMYFAKEGDVYVLATNDGAGANVHSTADWLKAYMPAGKNEMLVYGNVLTSGSANLVVGTGGLWHAKPSDSNYWLSDQGSAWSSELSFYVGTDGGNAMTAEFKMVGATVGYVSQNGNGFDVVEDAATKFEAKVSTKESGDYVYLTELIKKWKTAGYTKALLTMTTEESGTNLSSAAIWCGDGSDWFDKPAGETDTAHRITKLIDFSKLTEEEQFYLLISGSAVTDMTISLTIYE